MKTQDNKTVKRAKELQAKGIIYMASVVKSMYSTTYYHLVKVEDVIEKGKWIPAPHVRFAKGTYGRLGTIDTQIDWKVAARK